jgi:hypothetical protein
MRIAAGDIADRIAGVADCAAITQGASVVGRPHSLAPLGAVPGGVDLEVVNSWSVDAAAMLDLPAAHFQFAPVLRALIVHHDGLC